MSTTATTRQAVSAQANKYLTVVLGDEAYGIAVLKVREIIRRRLFKSLGDEAERQRVAAAGRNPDSLKVMFVCAPIVGETNAEALERFEKIDTLLFDKTGTLTLNKMTAVEFTVTGQNRYRVTGEGYETKGELELTQGIPAGQPWHKNTTPYSTVGKIQSAGGVRIDEPGVGRWCHRHGQRLRVPAER